MVWNVDFSDTAKKQLKKIDRQWQAKILDYLEDEIQPLDNPRNKGKALAGGMNGLWRYRVGDYRIICRIEDDRLEILVVTLGHRSRIYDKQGAG